MRDTHVAYPYTVHKKKKPNGPEGTKYFSLLRGFFLAPLHLPSIILINPYAAEPLPGNSQYRDIVWHPKG